MSRYVFKLPDLGEGTVEAEIVGWRVKPGDTVAEDDVVVEVMTEKAAVEVPAPVSGRVVSTTGAPGTWCRWAPSSSYSRPMRRPQAPPQPRSLRPRLPPWQLHRWLRRCRRPARLVAAAATAAPRRMPRQRQRPVHA